MNGCTLFGRKWNVPRHLIPDWNRQAGEDLVSLSFAAAGAAAAAATGAGAAAVWVGSSDSMDGSSSSSNTGGGNIVSSIIICMDVASCRPKKPSWCLFEVASADERDKNTAKALLIIFVKSETRAPPHEIEAAARVQQYTNTLFFV